MTFAMEDRLEQEIQTRIRLYDFSTGRESFFAWQAGMLGTVKGKKVLELGCGNGEFWQHLLHRWQDCDITLTDQSADILESASNRIGDAGINGNRIEYKQLDFNDLTPLTGQKYSIIIANHNLFYAENIYRLVGAIYSMLEPRGVLICSTVGRDHLHELISLLRARNPKLPWFSEKWADRFGLENAIEILSSLFQRVDQFEYDNNLHLPVAEPVMAYLMKTMKGELASWVEENWQSVSKDIQQVIDQRGYLRLTPHSGFCAARKA